MFFLLLGIFFGLGVICVCVCVSCFILAVSGRAIFAGAAGAAGAGVVGCTGDFLG